MSEQIYIALLDEGLPVWRPAPAIILQTNTYVVLRPDDYNPSVETWQFPSGTLVICEQKRLTDGIVPVAVRQTDDIRRTA